MRLPAESSRWPSAQRWCASHFDDSICSRVLDAGVQRATGILDTTEMHRDDATRVPLGAQIPAQLTVEMDELGCVCLSLREVAGPHLELDEMENAPGGRADAFELDSQREQVEQDRPSPRELSCGRGAPVRADGGLVGLGDARESRLQLDPLLEQALVETLPRQQLRHAELTGREEGKIPFDSSPSPEETASSGMLQRGPVVAADAEHAGEHGVRRRVGLRIALRLRQRAFLVRHRVARRQRVQLRAEPAEPDEHPCAIRPWRQRLGEVLEQREHVGLPLSRRRIEIRGLDQAPRRRGGVGVGCERGSALRQHRCRLRGAARVQAAGGVLELACDCLACYFRPLPEVEGALVGVCECVSQCQMDGAPLTASVHVQKRRSEQRMCEPRGSRVVVHDAGGPQLVEPGAVEASDHGLVDAPQCRRGEAGSPRSVRQGGQASPEGDGERLRHFQLRIPGRHELEREEGVSTGQLRELAELRRAERATGPVRKRGERGVASRGR